MLPVRVPDGRVVDLLYFVQWRTYLWARSTLEALKFLGPFEGKRALEIGGGNGRMSCLLALMGASVTMIDRVQSQDVEAEARKWDVTGRVNFLATDGTLSAVRGEKYDAVFGKSVLYSIKDLSHLLDELDDVLADGGKFAFVDNYRGGPLLMFLRRTLVYRNKRTTHMRYFGVQAGQLELFRTRFSNVRVKRSRYFIYEIFGEKKVSQ